MISESATMINPLATANIRVVLEKEGRRKLIADKVAEIKNSSRYRR